MSKRYIRVSNITYISPLQMEGPIVSPIPVSDSVVKELVRRGYNVTELINGEAIKLNNSNVMDPLKYKKKVEDAIEKEHTKQVIAERTFDKNAQITPGPVEETTPIEEPEEDTEYDFGNEVEEVDTSITPDPETVGRLFTGRPEPDVSEDIDSVAEVDTSSEGHVEDKKSIDNKSSNNNSGNRLQNKRKHRK